MQSDRRCLFSLDLNILYDWAEVEGSVKIDRDSRIETLLVLVSSFSSERNREMVNSCV